MKNPRNFLRVSGERLLSSSKRLRIPDVEAVRAALYLPDKTAQNFAGADFIMRCRLTSLFDCADICAHGGGHRARTDGRGLLHKSPAQANCTHRVTERDRTGCDERRVFAKAMACDKIGRLDSFCFHRSQ